MATPDPAAVASRVLAAAKYQHLDPGFVARAAAEASRTARSEAEAVKAAKRRLHQVFGAFVVGRPAAMIRRAGAVAAAASDPASRRDAFAAAMRTHASTAERLPFLDTVASTFADWFGQPGSVIDLACGLGPLAIPWLSLAEDADYRGCDVDADIVAALEELDAVLPVHLEVVACDLVTSTPWVDADVALLLKVVTTLEQQCPGRAAELLGELGCRDVVVSVPRRSLGGGRRYAVDPLDQVADVAAGTGYEVDHDVEIGPEHYVHLVRR